MDCGSEPECGAVGITNRITGNESCGTGVWAGCGFTVAPIGATLRTGAVGLGVPKTTAVITQTNGVQLAKHMSNEPLVAAAPRFFKV